MDIHGKNMLSALVIMLRAFCCSVVGVIACEIVGCNRAVRNFVRRTWAEDAALELQQYAAQQHGQQETARQRRNRLARDATGLWLSPSTIPSTALSHVFATAARSASQRDQDKTARRRRDQERRGVLGFFVLFLGISFALSTCMQPAGRSITHGNGVW